MISHFKRRLLFFPDQSPFHFLRAILQGFPFCHHYASKAHSVNFDGNPRRNDDSEAGLYLMKSKGQHLLTNPRILDTIVRKSAIKPTDTVLEIGPGTGNLTLRLLQVAKKVVAVELDSRMVEVLQKRVAESGFEDKLSVICQDALKAEFPPFDLVVANIPYGISSPLIIKLVYGKNPFRSATLLLQKEFARRLLANPGDSEFNRLAVNVKLVADVKFVMDVSKRDFLPCPKVDSSVVMIHPKLDVPEVNLDEWYAFTRTCFGKKNKTLGATFKQKKKVVELLKLSNQRDSISEETDDCDSEDGTNESSRLGEELGVLKEKIVGVLRNGGFEDKRPSKLKNEELLELLSLLNQAGVYFHDYENGGGSSSNVALADADYD
ncbi:Ribosomal RNA small subunit methyltransferase, mitochondrial [Linum perenne]